MPLPVPETPSSADVGLVGLAVMGANRAEHGRPWVPGGGLQPNETATTGEFIRDNPPSVIGPGGAQVPAADIKDFVRSIGRGRGIVDPGEGRAGTDAVINSPVPHLEAGDCVIDGGNAGGPTRPREGTQRQGPAVRGSGVSRRGRRAVRAFACCRQPASGVGSCLNRCGRRSRRKVDAKSGKPLMAHRATNRWRGTGRGVHDVHRAWRRGHYVKMVHNGIEYGDMQLICEAYHFMRDALGMSNRRWPRRSRSGTPASSTVSDRDHGGHPEAEGPGDGKDFVDIVLDAAGQKGTGSGRSTARWTWGAGADDGRGGLRAEHQRDEGRRVEAAKVLKPPVRHHHDHSHPPQKDWVACVRDALYCSKICSYAQGFALMTAASVREQLGSETGEIAMIFRGGVHHPGDSAEDLEAYQRRVTCPTCCWTRTSRGDRGAGAGRTGGRSWRGGRGRAGPRPSPRQLSYFDSYPARGSPRTCWARDYFGSHTYERTDGPREVLSPGLDRAGVRERGLNPVRVAGPSRTALPGRPSRAPGRLASGPAGRRGEADPPASPGAGLASAIAAPRRPPGHRRSRVWCGLQTLATERLLMRPLQGLRSQEFLRAVRESRDAAARFMPCCCPTRAGTTPSRVNWRLRGRGPHGARLASDRGRPDQRIVGGFNVNDIRRGLENRGEIALGPPGVAGRGLATEGLAAAGGDGAGPAGPRAAGSSPDARGGLGSPRAWGLISPTTPRPSGWSSGSDSCSSRRARRSN